MVKGDIAISICLRYLGRKLIIKEQLMKKISVLLTGFMLLWQLNTAQSQSCSLASDLSASISLDAQCSALVDPMDYINASPNCTTNFSVDLFNEVGQLLSTSPYVTSAELGTQVTAVITNLDENVSCSVLLDILDKSVPSLICGDLIFSCTEENVEPKVFSSSNTSFSSIQNDCEIINFNISGEIGTVQDVNISLDLDLNNSNDFEIILADPFGAALVLLADDLVGCLNNNLTISLDENSTLTYNDLSTACSASDSTIGVFQALGPLSHFNGGMPNGNWELSICNNTSNPIYFHGASLNISTSSSIIPLPLPAGVVATPTSNNTYSLIGFDGCGTAILSYQDLVDLPNCQSDYNKVIERNWIVEDLAGNQQSCTQVISFLREAPQDVDLPGDRSVALGNALHCDNQTPTPAGTIPNIGWNSLPNGNPSPDNEYYPAPNDDIVKWFGTGRPEVGGCFDLDFTYSDLRIEQCSNGASQSCFKVNRTWTAIDPCDGSTFTHLQQIYVIDPVGPTITGISDVTISTKSNSCEADWLVPIPVLNDNCSDPSTLTYSVASDFGYLTFDASTNQYTVNDLPVGDNQVNLLASDCCGTTTTKTINVQVRDLVPPYVVCETFRTIGLGNNGVAKLFASSFDDGSNDGCGPVFFKVIRYDDLLGTENGSTANQNTLNGHSLSGDDDTSLPENQIYFDDEVFLCCDDIDVQTMVVLRVFDINPGSGPVEPSRMAVGGDLFGRFNDCMPFVNTEDKLPPQVFCPANITLNCEDDYTDLGITGMATASDNCELISLTHQDSESLNQCNVGVVTRVWTATDHTGRTASCVQYITLQDLTDPVITFPSNRTIDCTEINDLSVTGSPEVDDNCALIGWNFSDEVFQISGTCNQKIVRTWSGMDLCDWVAYSHVQTLIAEDSEAPVFTNVPADVTVSCDNIPTAADVQAVDECDNFESLVFEENIAGQTCDHTYILQRIWTASDACGNTDVLNQFITVEDIEAPMFDSIPQDMTLECFDQAVNIPLTSTDNCDPNPMVMFVENIISGDCPNRYTLVRTWTATDICGNDRVINQNLVFSDDEGPTLMNVPVNVTIVCGEQVPAVPTVTAVDNCDGNIVPVLTLQDGMQPCVDGIVQTRIWTATDLCGNITIDSQQVFLFDTEGPTLLNIPPDQTLSCEANTPSGMPTANDDCNGVVPVESVDKVAFSDCFQTFTITKIWTAIDNCNNQTVDSTRYTFIDDEAPVLTGEFDDITISCADDIPANTVTINDNCDGNPMLSNSENEIPGDCAQEKMIVRSWTGTDGCGNDTTITRTITIIDDQAPKFDARPDDMTVECDAIPAIPNVGAQDSCDPNPTLSFNEERTDGDCTFNYVLTRTWTATDDCENSNSITQVVTVRDTQPPIFNGGPTLINASCDNVPPRVNPTAVDNCDNSVTLGFNEIRIDSTCANLYRLNRTWTASDDCGNESTFVQNVIVRDTEAPVLSGIPMDITIDCSAPPPPPFVVSVTDNCNMDIVIEVTLDTLSIECPGMGVIRRTWTADDGCGNSTSETQTVTFINASSPELVGVPDDITVDCSAIPTAAMPTASGACGSFVTIVLEETIADGNCPFNYTLTRSWTAKDECENSTTLDQVITVQDLIAPTLSDLPQDITIDCNSQLDTINPIAMDNCDTSLTLVFVETEIELDCSLEKILERRWTYTDDCNNKVSHVQRIMVQDTMAPVIMNIPADITISCIDADMDFGEPTVMDNCDDVDLEEEESEAIECVGTFVLTRTWTAEDACGNSATASQIITVKDEDAPVFSDMPADLTVDCDNLPAIPNLTILDSCDEDPTLDFNETQIAGNCPGNYQLQRIWIASDDCNNIARDTQLITVLDTLPPTFVDFPDDFTVQCASAPAINQVVVQAMDNCDANVEIQIVQTNPALDSICINQFRIERIYTAIDHCNNRTVDTLYITVHDEEDPFFNVSIPDSITVQCDNIPTGNEITAIDNCGIVDVTFSADTILGFCTNTFIIDRYFVAQDPCGNSRLDTMRIKVIDTIPPTFTFVDTFLTVSCDELPVDVPGVVATDNCGLMGDVQFVQDKTDEECLHTYKLVRSWSIIDECSNSSETIQIIQVRDSIGPVLVSVVNDITVSCDSIPTGEDVLFEDSCDGEPTVDITDFRMDGNCDNNFVLTRRFVALDACMNNSDTIFQSISVFDSGIPTFECPVVDTSKITNLNVNEDCTIWVNIPIPFNIFDNCDSMPIVSHNSLYGDPDSSAASGFYPLGSTIVTYYVTDACGNLDSCEVNVVVIDKEDPAIACNGIGDELEIGPDGTVRICVEQYMNQASDCQEFERFFLPDSTQCLTFDCNQVGQTVNLIAVAIDIDGNDNGCFNQVVISDPDGNCNGLSGEQIHGLIANEDDRPTADIPVFVDGSQGNNTSTNDQGEYVITNAQVGENYTILPRSNRDVRAGITTLDLVQLSRHIIGLQALDSPYKLIAADVDYSNTLDAFDILELQKLIIFDIPEFQNGNAWRFVDKNYDFKNPSQPLMEYFPELIEINPLQVDPPSADFISVKLGDLNNSYLGLPENLEKSKWNWQIPNLNIPATKQFILPLYAEAYEHWNGLQAELFFDNTSVKIVELIPGQLNPVFNLQKDRLLISCISNGVESIDEKEPIFSILLEANSLISSNSIFTLGNKYLPAYVVSKNEISNTIGLEVKQSNEITVQSSKDLPILFSNRPNPFSEQTTIRFSIPEEGNVVLSIMDVSGRTLYRQEQYLKEGYHEVVVLRDQLKAEGVLISQLVTTKGIVSQKLLLLNQ